MTRRRVLKTNFTAGEVSPELIGRADLSAFENGAARLRNAVVLPTGGVSRRPGLRYVATARNQLTRLTGTLTTPNGGAAGVADDGDWQTSTATTTPIGTTDPYVVAHCDLGSVETVAAADAIGFALSAGGPTDGFRIQYSADDASWTDFDTAIPIGTAAHSVRRRGGVAARYWRLVRTDTDDLGAATVSLACFNLWEEAATPSTGRLLAFEFNTEQTYFVCATQFALSVYADDAFVAELPTPWDEGVIGKITWAQSADTLLVCHADHPPKRIIRTLMDIAATPTEQWRVTEWAWVDEDTVDEAGTALGTARRHPFHKFAEADVTIAPSGTVKDSTITLTASADVFDGAHEGHRFRIDERQVEITGVTSPTSASAVVKETLRGTDSTRDWEEPAFSALHGWPASVGFHQDRLVLGGGRDLPNRLWLSKSGDLYNFDLGEGLDDEAIEFAILSDQVNAIQNVFSGRHLQVFTSGAEWMVTGDPLTPGNVQLKRQTRVGSPVARNVPPRDVDGATLFVSRNGHDLREFLFADVEQAYQANDLALVAKHVMKTPVDQDYNQVSRLLHVVMGDGTLATVTVYRAEQVTAWSVQTTDGSFLSVAVVGDSTYVLVDRSTGRFVECFDTTRGTDAGVSGTIGTPTTTWSGLDHLNGKTVQLVADGALAPDATVSSGTIALAIAASNVEAGLPFTLEIEPLPAAVDGRTAQGLSIRMIEATFRLLDTRVLAVDTGKGLRDLPFKTLGHAGVLDTGPASFTGDVMVRGLGWLRATQKPAWRIAQDAPLPCTVLSVSTEFKATD